MQFSVISSGSKANCTFIDTGTFRILIDCGLSATQCMKRLVEVGVDPESIDAVIVTHEHYDHIAGIPVLSRKLKIPVYANRSTAKFLRSCFAIEYFKTGEDFHLGDATISAFSIPHDAADPVGFTIQRAGLKFVYLTDLGKVTPLVQSSIRNAHAIVLESNHDEQLLSECGYPWELKQRILSSHGHLSNDTSANLLAEIMHSDLQHVVLGHISENSNTPEHALAAAKKHLNGSLHPSLHCGSVRAALPLLRIGEVATTSSTTMFAAS